jgi:PAS domain-containing protein
MKRDQKMPRDERLTLDASFMFFEQFMDSFREPLVILDSDLKVVRANDAFYRMFKVKPGVTEGLLIYHIGDHQWDIPRLRDLLEDILPRNSIFNDFEVEHDFEGIGPKIMHLNARRIYEQEHQTQLILLAMEDVTDREFYKKNLE